MAAHVISVCVGSSCHLKGAYEVIREFQRALAEYDLEDQVELKACFCLGACEDGVSIMLDGKVHRSLIKEKVEDFLREYLLTE